MFSMQNKLGQRPEGSEAVAAPSTAASPRFWALFFKDPAWLAETRTVNPGESVLCL